jgi:hypothetical protein
VVLLVVFTLTARSRHPRRCARRTQQRSHMGSSVQVGAMVYTLMHENIATRLSLSLPGW